MAGLEHLRALDPALLDLDHPVALAAALGGGAGPEDVGPGGGRRVVVAVVDVPVEVQIERTMDRDTDSRDQVERIIAAQIPREKRLHKADEVIDNNQVLGDVERRVGELHKKFAATLG